MRNVRLTGRSQRAAFRPGVALAVAASVGFVLSGCSDTSTGDDAAESIEAVADPAGSGSASARKPVLKVEGDEDAAPSDEGTPTTSDGMGDSGDADDPPSTTTTTAAPPTTATPSTAPPTTAAPTTAASTAPPTTEAEVTILETRIELLNLALPTYGGGTFNPDSMAGKNVILWFWGAH